MYLEKINYLSKEYWELIQIRQEILRSPLGLVYNQSDIDNEKDDIILALKYKDKFIGTCHFLKQEDLIFKLRQVAIAFNYQRKGYGKKMIILAEEYAKEMAIKNIILNSRYSVKDFYKSLNYIPISKIFFEVGIEHITMIKKL